MPKTLIDLPVEAGIYTEQTARGARGYWKDGDKIRFRYGLIEKIGGWSQIPGELIGLARKLWDWSSLDTRVWTAIGTEAKLYLLNSGTYTDITPLRRQVSLVDPINTTNLSDLVTINDPSHGAQEGDYCQISGAGTVGGIIVDGEYRIQSITDIDNYVIQDDQTATSTATGGGTVQIQYDISVGLSNTSFGTGWNTGTWSQETWNTPRTVSTTVQLLRTWSLDNWGEDLIAVPRGGSMYWWDRGTGATARAIELSNAPDNINYMIISQRDRHIFALGCTEEFSSQFDPLLIRWCSQEDFDDWIPTSTNTSGDLRLFRGSFIQAAIRTRGEILLFTDVSVHQINYLGGTAVYGLQTVGENVSILSPNAAIEVDFRVFFMAEADFYVYDGILQAMPSTVRNRVYENITIAQKEKIFAGLNREFNEIWFFYPGKDENTYWETDFAQGTDADNYRKLLDTNADDYSVSFDASGWIEVAGVSALASGLSQIWMRTDGAALIPDATDFEAQLRMEFTDTANSTQSGGFINFTDPGGNDDETGFLVGFNPSTNDLQIWRKRSADTVWASVASVDCSTLSPALTITAASTWAVTLTIVRTATQIDVHFYDERNSQYYTSALQYTLTVQDEIDFATGSVGVGGSLIDPADDPMRYYMVAASDIGILSANQGQGTATNEINRYAIYNYQEETWAIGQMARTAWADRSPAFNKPYAAGTDMFLYKHETGKDDDGAAMPAYAETYDMELPEAGEYESHIDRLVPDFLRLEGSVDITLKGKKYPQVQDYREKGPFTVTATTRKIAPRLKGRQIAMRLDSSAAGDAWRMGTMRARVTPHGKRT